MRTKITTVEIAEMFGKAHRNVMRDIRSIIACDPVISLLFVESEYVSKQNKKLQSFTVSVDGFCVLTDAKNYSKGDNAYVKADILREFGEKFSICSYSKKRSEELFYEKLKRFIPNQEIIRQYPIGKHKVDFYIVGLSIIIEYDESYHNALSARASDDKRFKEINRFLNNEIDEGINMIRVKSSNEEAGLAAIAGYMCLNMTNELCEYYESYERKNPEHSC